MGKVLIYLPYQIVLLLIVLCPNKHPSKRLFLPKVGKQSLPTNQPVHVDESVVLESPILIRVR